MRAFIDSLGPWLWLTLGVVLIGLELFAPGVFLLWLGLAAIATGILDALVRPAWEIDALAFVVFSVVSVGFGRWLMRGKGALPSLNRRAEGLVGRDFTLETPIERGEGQLRVGDSVWRIIGPDLPAGAKIRVVELEGASLRVEPAG